MPIKKCAAAMAVCSLVCLAVLGIRTPAAAQHEEKKAEAGSITKAVAVLHPTQGSQVANRIDALFATALGRAFFQAHTAFESLMLSLLTYGIGFASRPVGASYPPIGNKAMSMSCRAPISLNPSK